MGGEEDSNLLRAMVPDTCYLPLNFTPPKPRYTDGCGVFSALRQITPIIIPENCCVLNIAIIAKIKGGFLCIFYSCIVPSTFRSARSSARRFIHMRASSTCWRAR